MLASAHEKDLRPRLLLFITRTEDEKRLEALLDEVHVPIFYQCRGKGTAPSEMLDIFGLSGSVRLITLGILPKFLVPNALKKIGRQLYFHQRAAASSSRCPLRACRRPFSKRSMRRRATSSRSRSKKGSKEIWPKCTSIRTIR